MKKHSWTDITTTLMTYGLVLTLATFWIKGMAEVLYVPLTILQSLALAIGPSYFLMKVQWFNFDR